MKLLVTATAVAFMLTGAATAAADVEVERSKVKFTMSSDDCPNLRSGTTIKGSGKQRSVTTTTTDANGITTVVNYTRARGKAKDHPKNGACHRLFILDHHERPESDAVTAHTP